MTLMFGLGHYTNYSTAPLCIGKKTIFGPVSTTCVHYAKISSALSLFNERRYQVALCIESSVS